MKKKILTISILFGVTVIAMVVYLVESAAVDEAFGMGEEVVGETEVEWGGFVEAGDLFVGEGVFNSAEVVFELVGDAGADDGEHDSGLLADVVDGDLGGGAADFCCHRRHPAR